MSSRSCRDHGGAGENPRYHFLLLAKRHVGESAIGESPQQLVSGRGLAAIGEGSKLRKEVKNAHWHGPAECEEARDFGARVVGDEE